MNDLKNLINAGKTTYKFNTDRLIKKRPYRLTKAFPLWNDVCAIGVTLLANYKLFCRDEPFFHHINLWKLWVDNNYPLYAIEPEILEQLLETEAKNLPTLVPTDWMPPFEGTIVMLPNDALKVYSSNEYIMYITIQFTNYVDSNNIDGNQVTITAMASNSQIFYSTTPIKDFALIDFMGIPTSIVNFDATDEQLISDIRKIALQSLMLISYQPEMVEEEASGRCVDPLRKFKSSEFISPRWIGKNFKRVRVSGKKTVQGTHSWVRVTF
jgi:hypothetical protein